MLPGCARFSQARHTHKLCEIREREHRPPMSIPRLGLQRDLRACFGSYSHACRLADEVLFQAGKAELVDEACRKSPVGKLLPNALYVHRSALDGLSPLLRVYEGCAGPTWARLMGPTSSSCTAIPAKFRTSSILSLRLTRILLWSEASNCRCALARSIALNTTRAEPADPASKGDVSRGRSSAVCQVCPADSAGGEAWAA